MLQLKINVENDQQRKDIGDMIHDSLVGSPAYISSEVLLNYTDLTNQILLIVGLDNENAVTINTKIEGQ